MSEYLLISDAAKEVHVESHVLRYWEEELHLPIKRNELGHRYYTEEDVNRFKQIKSMKERGLQLKAIKMILRDGKLDVISGAESEKEDCLQVAMEGTKIAEGPVKCHMAPAQKEGAIIVGQEKEEKARRLQWLLQQMIRETLSENNAELCREMKESIIKELDYQFRAQEEREEERDRVRTERSENYYQKMDELLRKKTGKREKSEKIGKKKRHFIF